MTDIYGAPAARGAAVTPSDSTPVRFRALYIGGTGDVSVLFAEDTNDTAVVLAAVPAGTVLPIVVKRVRSTGTTATNIVGLV